MNKSFVLSEIHGIVLYVIGVPDSAFSDAGKKAKLIDDLTKWYDAVATDMPSAEVDAKYSQVVNTMEYITDPDIKTRATTGVGQINNDIKGV